MRPVKGARCLMPEWMVQTNLETALNLLFAVDPPTQWVRCPKPATIAAGFKIMIHQITGLREEQRFWDYLTSRSIKVIVCLRYNILMQYVSDLITIATRQPACWDGKVRTAKVEVNLKTLGLELQRIIDQKAYLRHKLAHLEIDAKHLSYETFANSYTSVEGIMEWLIGTRHHLTTKLSKQNPDNLADRVVNFNELVAEVRRLGLGHLLIDSSTRS